MEEGFKAYIRGILGEKTDAELLALDTTTLVTLRGLYETARAGNNCVVFIMWLRSSDFISSSR